MRKKQMTIKKKINLLIIIFVVIIVSNAISTFYGDNKVSSLNKQLQNESNIANQLNKIKYTIKSLQESSLKISLSSNPEDINKLTALRNNFIKEIKFIKQLTLDENVKKSIQHIEKGFDELYEKLRNISVMGIHKETQKKLSNLKLQEFIETITQTKDTLINLYSFIIRNNVTKMQTQIATMESAYITVLASGNEDRLTTADTMRKKILRTLTRAMKRKPEGSTFIQKQMDNINKLSQIGNELAVFGIGFVEYSQLQEENIINTNLTVKNYFSSLDKLSKQLESNVSSIIIENNDSLYNLLIIAIVSTVFSIIFLIFLWIISKSIIYNITRLSRGVDTLMSYSSADQEIDIKSNDEIGHLAHSFNTYMKSLRTTMIQDQKIVEEAEKAIQMVKAGFFVYTIKNSSTNRSTNDLKNAVNEMIHDLNDKFSSINQALMEYGNTNFDYNIDVKDASGTIGSIVSGTKAIGSNVSELLATIMISGEKLSENIDVLSNAANSLSDSANNQASSLEQTAASVEEMTINNKENISNIVTMSKLADTLTSTSNEGKTLAFQTSKSMEEIEQKVSSISDAITIIDTISFQTNILSLNAAVEAATAGEAGKGFAVVAQEVRNLASRSAQAAKDIKKLVNLATCESKNGKEISLNMIDGYNNLNNQITQTQNIIEQVTTASLEQEKGMIQINDAIGHLDKTTQENASNASSIHDLSVEIQDLSNNLIHVANYSKYDENSREQVCDVNFSNKLNTLKLNHLKFKESCFDSLDSKDTITIEHHEKSELGLWIKEAEDFNHHYSNNPNWIKLKTHHKIVHEKIQEYIDENVKNASNDELLLIANEIERASTCVFETLNITKSLNCQTINNTGEAI